MNAKEFTGRLCSRSFASNPENHVRSIGIDGWGACVGCGEVLNTTGDCLPEHVIPEEDES